DIFPSGLTVMVREMSASFQTLTASTSSALITKSPSRTEVLDITIGVGLPLRASPSATDDVVGVPNLSLSSGAWAQEARRETSTQVANVNKCLIRLCRWAVIAVCSQLNISATDSLSVRWLTR